MMEVDEEVELMRVGAVVSHERRGRDGDEKP